MQKTLFLFLTCLLYVGRAYAQKEANIWAFGNGMALNFKADTTEIRSEIAIQLPVACASIADKNGNLLFYTDGVTMWNGEHEQIQKSESLRHNASVLIVPKPEQEGVYYVIGVLVMNRASSIPHTKVALGDTIPTVDMKGYWGKKDSIYVKEAVLSYSVVDMRKNRGRGEVIQKNVPLMDSCWVNICAIKHENKKDFWLVVRQNYSQKFLAYKIDKQGISAQPITTEIGNTIQYSHQGYQGLSSMHKLKGSLNGKKIAFLGEHIFDTNIANSGTTLEFFDFDNASGKLSNPHKLKIPQLMHTACLEFSPDSKQLLVGGIKHSPMYKHDESRPSILHINLMLPQGRDITKFGEKLFTDYKPKDTRKYFQPIIKGLQLAPNGKIYGFVENYNFFNMIVLHNPNAPAKDFKMQFEYPLPQNYLGNFPNCTHLLPNENELSTVFAVGKVFSRYILFDTNNATLKPEYEKELADIVTYLLKNLKATIEITGHTDNEGEEVKNQKLSEARAQALANFLIKNNIDIDTKRIKTIGYGSSKPITENTSPEGRAKNRRIEFLVK